MGVHAQESGHSTCAAPKYNTVPIQPVRYNLQGRKNTQTKKKGPQTVYIARMHKANVRRLHRSRTRKGGQTVRCAVEPAYIFPSLILSSRRLGSRIHCCHEDAAKIVNPTNWQRTHGTYVKEVKHMSQLPAVATTGRKRSKHRR